MTTSASIRMSVYGRSLSHVIVLGVALTGILVTPAAVHAQDGHTTAAESLFQQGRGLMAEKRYSEACAKFEASHKLAPSVGALLNLCDCRQKNGQTASAWTELHQAIALARQKGDLQREQFARKWASDLEGRLSYLLIEVPEGVRVPGLVVIRNGVVVNELLWSQSLPVDPGVHTLEVNAPGYKPTLLRVEVPPGRGETRVYMPVLAPVLNAGKPDHPETEPRAENVGEAGPSVVRASRHAVRPAMPVGRRIALLSGGLALAGVAAGTVFGLQARSRWSDAQALCGDRPDSCTPEGVTLSEDAASTGNRATLAFSVGLAAAAAGALLWSLSAPGGTAGKSAAPVSPVVGPDTLGASIHLHF